MTRRTRRRPRKLSAAITQRLTQAIGLGGTYEQAAGYAGLSYRTLRRHLARGEAEAQRLVAHPGARPRASEREFLDFCQAIKKSEAVRVLHWLGLINHAANTHWQATAWLLERRYPEDYGRKVRHRHHAGEVTAQVQVIRFPPGSRTPDAWA